MRKNTILPVLLLLFLTNGLFAQIPILGIPYPDTLNKKRTKWVIGCESAVVITTMSALYTAWYKDYSTGVFHWKDDNPEWMYMDKLGHFTTSTYIGKYTYEFNRHAGISETNSILISGGISMVYMNAIELMDGYSKGWGFSTGDLIANTSGTALFVGQQFLWHEQRFLLKMGYHSSDIRNTFLQNPDYKVFYQKDSIPLGKIYKTRFGTNAMENFLKDYNGQTYWLSANIASFLPEGIQFPKWLNIAIGTGAGGMQGAKSDDAQVIADFHLHPRYRQYYFSLDVDFTRIKTKSKVLSLLFHSIGYLKFPFPTLEYNQYDGIKFHALFF
jgi:uncharacterized protein YfiM (DUF2279 family)